jgi:hypothetical protein
MEDCADCFAIAYLATLNLCPSPATVKYQCKKKKQALWNCILKFRKIKP